MTFLLGLKARAIVLGAAALAMLAVIIRIKALELARDKANARAYVAEAERDQVRSNVTISKKTRSERREQRKRAVKTITEGGVPASLGDDLNNWG